MTLVRIPSKEEEFTRRELQVLDLLSYGKTHLEIAATLHISYHTVRHHSKGILRKTGAKTYHQAVAFAFMDGIVQ